MKPSDHVGKVITLRHYERAQRCPLCQQLPDLLIETLPSGEKNYAIRCQNKVHSQIIGTRFVKKHIQTAVGRWDFLITKYNFMRRTRSDKRKFFGRARQA